MYGCREWPLSTHCGHWELTLLTFITQRAYETRMRNGCMLRTTHATVVAVASLLFAGCNGRSPEGADQLEWESPSAESLSQCVSLSQAHNGLTPITTEEIKREIVGHSVAYYMEGESPLKVQRHVVHPKGIYLQPVDNAVITSIYKVRGNCLCIGAGTFQCQAFFKDASGNLRALLNGLQTPRPVYVYTRPL